MCNRESRRRSAASSAGRGGSWWVEMHTRTGVTLLLPRERQGQQGTGRTACASREAAHGVRRL